MERASEERTLYGFSDWEADRLCHAKHYTY